MAMAKAQIKRLQALGAVVRAAREMANLTQEGLAELADIERSYVSDIERGTRNVSVLVLWRLADQLGVKFSKLLATAEEAV